MTALTPKREERKTSSSRLPLPAVLGLSALLAFAVFAIGLLRILPAPHTSSDYLVVGSLATLAGLITVFGAMVLGRRR